MSRGPGRTQQGIAALIASEPDGAWTTTQLCRHIYGRYVEKKHRVAVSRALRRMKLPPLWEVVQLAKSGAEYCLHNTGSLESTHIGGWRKQTRGSTAHTRRDPGAGNGHLHKGCVDRDCDCTFRYSVTKRPGRTCLCAIGSAHES
jgi:hypothetical protein